MEVAMNTLTDNQMTPAEALEKLLAGEKIKVNCHTVLYDDDDMMTWYTNPYGIDGIICGGKPTLEAVTQFLSDMAAGVDYGPTPEWGSAL